MQWFFKHIESKLLLPGTKTEIAELTNTPDACTDKLTLLLPESLMLTLSLPDSTAYQLVPRSPWRYTARWRKKKEHLFINFIIDFCDELYFKMKVVERTSTEKSRKKPYQKFLNKWQSYYLLKITICSCCALEKATNGLHFKTEIQKKKSKIKLYRDSSKSS